MKRFLLLTLFIPLSSIMKSQELVVDPAVAILLGTQQFNEDNTYSDIKDNQDKIKSYQLAITATLGQIRELEAKTQKYLQTINSVVQNAKDVVYASTIASDIGKYQNQTYEMAKGDPKLITVALKSEYELATKSLEIITEIYNFALKDGEKNMLDNKQRIDMVKHVVKELQIMRGMAYTVYRQIKAAKRDGVLKALMPEQFQYVNNGKRHVEKILKDAKWVKNGGKYKK